MDDQGSDEEREVSRTAALSQACLSTDHSNNAETVGLAAVATTSEMPVLSKLSP